MGMRDMVLKSIGYHAWLVTSQSSCEHDLKTRNAVHGFVLGWAKLPQRLTMRSSLPKD